MVAAGDAYGNGGGLTPLTMGEFPLTLGNPGLYCIPGVGPTGPKRENKILILSQSTLHHNNTGQYVLVTPFELNWPSMRSKFEVGIGDGFVEVWLEGGP